MNDQNQTTSTPSEPTLCKMGCGFFGSNATGDCCSKCWNDLRKNKDGGQPVTSAASTTTTSQPSQSPSPKDGSLPSADVKMDDVAKQPEPMDVVAPESSEAVVAEAEVKQPAAADTSSSSPPVVKKKKKKKKGYKNLLADMMKESGERDVEKEKDNIKKVTGGGAFVKIDKI